MSVVAGLGVADGLQVRKSKHPCAGEGALAAVELVLTPQTNDGWLEGGACMDVFYL